MDAEKIEACVTKNTKAIIPVHYGGTSCNMDKIVEIASLKKLEIIEDGAHSFLGSYQDKKIGTFGKFAAFSFHETKNIQCGQGGAIIFNKEDEFTVSVFLEKGTNRKLFDMGKVDNYTWKGVGSNCLMSELHATVLWSQLNSFTRIHKNRKESWERYHLLFCELEEKEVLTRPVIKRKEGFVYHNYYIILSNSFDRNEVLNELGKYGVHAVSHYQPLHSSEAGKKFGSTFYDLSVTEFVSQQIIRLPFFFGLSENDQLYVFDSFKKVINNLKKYYELLWLELVKKFF